MNLGRSAIRLAWLAPAGLIALAQQPEAPVLGYLVDQTAQRIRGVWGVPGAAQVGDLIELGVAIVSGAASPRADYVLALTGDLREPMLWLPGSASPRAIAGLPAGADQIYLSPEGSAAAVWYRGENRVLVISGLPNSPRQPVNFELTALQSPLAALAVSDDGQLIALGEGEAGPAASSVIILSGAGERNRFAAVGGARAVAFFPRSHAFIFSSAEQAWLVRGDGLADERVPLAESFADASSVAIDGDWALFAHPATGRVALRDLANLSTPAAVLDCGCTPEVLVKMRGGLRLHEYRGSSLRMLDLAAHPRVVFAAPARALEAAPERRP